jgi:hypothetical protein
MRSFLEHLNEVAVEMRAGPVFKYTGGVCELRFQFIDHQ